MSNNTNASTSSSSSPTPTLSPPPSPSLSIDFQTPLTVIVLSPEGLEHTNLNHLFSDLKYLENAKNFGELGASFEELKSHMLKQHHNIISDMECTMDTHTPSPSSSSSSPSLSPSPPFPLIALVNTQFTERRLLGLTARAAVTGEGRPSTFFGSKVNNLFGNGEKLEMNFEYSPNSLEEVGDKAKQMSKNISQIVSNDEKGKGHSAQDIPMTSTFNLEYTKPTLFSIPKWLSEAFTVSKWFSSSSSLSSSSLSSPSTTSSFPSPSPSCLPPIPVNATFSVYQANVDRVKHSSLIEYARGGKLSLSANNHNISIDSSYRNSHPTARQLDNGQRDVISNIVQNANRPSQINSFTYSLSKSSLNHPIMPTKGFAQRYSATYAGGPLGGHENYAKFHHSMAWAHSFTPRLSFALFSHQDIAIPLNGQKHISLFDRFYLRPMTLRGMDVAHIGPHDQKDNVGGDCLGSATAYLAYKIPQLEEWNLHLHAFGNAASNVELFGGTQSKVKNFGEGVDRMKEGINYSAGVGIVIPTPGFKMEINAIVGKNGLKHSKLEFAIGADY